MHRKTCIDCSTPLSGHGTPERCRGCAARKRYVDRFGHSPKMLVTSCGVCDSPIRDYATNHTKSKMGEYFCSEKCRREWVRVHNSISRGGDGVPRTKSERDALDYVKHIDSRKTRSRAYYQTNRDKILTEKQAADRALKAEIVQEYGGKCTCCGESHIEFLTIDHVNGDGAEHRARLGKGRKIYADIKAQGFPKDKYQLLCFNCNITLGFYGYCPHHPERRRAINHKPRVPGRKPKVENLAEKKGSPRIDFEVVLCTEKV